MRFLILACALTLSAPAWAQDETPPAATPDAGAVDMAGQPALPPVSFGGPQPLLIDTGEARHAFIAEIASTPEQLTRGLMGRETLAPDAAMLFVYMPPRRASMWMENTLIPLDMLFIRVDGTVVKLISHAQPGSHRSLGSDFTVAAVLEIAGGRAAELGLRPGAIIRHEMFGTDIADTAAADAPAAPDAEQDAQ